MPDARRGLATLACAFACVGCSGGDYWLGGGTGPGGGAGPATRLSGDWVVSGPDAVEIGGGPGPCRIVGNGYGIVSQDAFSGQLWIHDCAFIGLGGADRPAIAVDVADPGSVVIERCTFSQSGALQIGNFDSTPTTFRDNVVFADSAITLDATVSASTPAFLATGPSAAPKLFQGNRIYRGALWLTSPNWLVGGDSDAQSNFLIGLRAGVVIGSPGIVLRGNYMHDEHLTDAGDESCIETDYSVTDALAEHNVLRRGSWVVRGFGGEFRYNAVLDPDNLAFIQQPFENTRVHHNLFALCAPAIGGAQIQAAFQLVNNRAGGIELFNNTFDGGGAALRFGGPVVSVEPSSLLASLRSNLLTNFWFGANTGDAAVRPGLTEGLEPADARLGYSDYNLFYNQSEATLRNYGISVAGLRERLDAGFALNDAAPGGVVDQQVSPNLTGAAACFPFSDDDLRAGSVTVSQMLATLRAAYTPLPGSPALGGGDPQDGAGNFIGSVGDGTLPSDLFGRFAAN